MSQSSTMPVLSLHNTYTLPSGSASYTLGLSGAPNVASYSYRTSVGGAPERIFPGVSNICGSSGLSTVNPFSKCFIFHKYNFHYMFFTFFIAYPTYTNPLLASGGVVSSIRKTYDDLDLIVGGRYGPRPLTPTSPLIGNWAFENCSGLDGINSAFVHTQPHSCIGALDLESKRRNWLIS